jgi:hypothetical protein
MISRTPTLFGAEPLSDWRGHRVKGLLGSALELLFIGELVEVSGIGVELSCRGRKHFFPWNTVHSLALDDEEREAA